jgi:hypothetical protein
MLLLLCHKMIFLRGKRAIAILDVKRTQEMASLPNQYKKFQRTFCNFSFACGCKLLHRKYVLNLNNKSYDVSHM